MLYLIPELSDFGEVCNFADSPVVEVSYNVADQLGELLKEDRIFIPLLLDGAGQAVRNRIRNGGVGLRFLGPARLDRNIVEDIERLDQGVTTSLATTCLSSN